MKFFNIFLILACSFLFAGELNLKQIQKKPKVSQEIITFIEL